MTKTNQQIEMEAAKKFLCALPEENAERLMSRALMTLAIAQDKLWRTNPVCHEAFNEFTQFIEQLYEDFKKRVKIKGGKVEQ
tara:strand:- start:649 stop:894 length:246 start_codon:yes stop_codon:yes gene_type:complete